MHTLSHVIRTAVYVTEIFAMEACVVLWTRKEDESSNVSSLANDKSPVPKPWLLVLGANMLSTTPDTLTILFRTEEQHNASNRLDVNALGGSKTSWLASYKCPSPTVLRFLGSAK